MKNWVSWSSSAFKPPTKQVDLTEWICGNENRTDVLLYRKGYMAKNALPCITPAGLFSGDKQVKSLVTSSGILFLDIDAKDNDIVACRHFLEECEYTRILTVSSSGKGLHVFMNVPEGLDSRTYTTYHIQMERFLMKYGINIDPAAKNINRLRYASYDPKPYINNNAPVLPLWTKNVAKKRKDIAVDNNLKQQVLKVLKGIENHEWDISKVYNDWIYLAGFFYNVFGDEDGLSMFIRLSKFYPNYDANETIRKYDQCKTFKHISLGKFFKLIKPYESKSSKKVRK